MWKWLKEQCLIWRIKRLARKHPRAWEMVRITMRHRMDSKLPPETPRDRFDHHP